MTHDEAFLEAIREHPDDDVPRADLRRLAGGTRRPAGCRRRIHPQSV